MKEEIEAVRDHLWFGFRQYITWADYSENSGTWLFRWGGGLLRVVPGDPLKVMNEAGETFSILPILGKVWKVAEREVYGLLLENATAGRVMVPGKLSRRWFSGS